MICCVTGHRTVLDKKINYVKTQLKEEAVLAIKDGYTNFISGFADGVDLYFSEIIIELKKYYPEIKLAAAIPYRDRVKTPNKQFQQLILQCDFIKVISEKYFNGCFMKRNRWMVENTGRVIAVYDGRGKGGTYSTICYACDKKRELRIIEI